MVHIIFPAFERCDAWIIRQVPHRTLYVTHVIRKSVKFETRQEKLSYAMKLLQMAELREEENAFGISYFICTGK